MVYELKWDQRSRFTDRGWTEENCKVLIFPRLVLWWCYFFTTAKEVCKSPAVCGVWAPSSHMGRAGGDGLFFLLFCFLMQKCWAKFAASVSRSKPRSAPDDKAAVVKQPFTPSGHSWLDLWTNNQYWVWSVSNAFKRTAHHLTMWGAKVCVCVCDHHPLV